MLPKATMPAAERRAWIRYATMRVIAGTPAFVDAMAASYEKEEVAVLLIRQGVNDDVALRIANAWLLGEMVLNDMHQEIQDTARASRPLPSQRKRSS